MGYQIRRELPDFFESGIAKIHNEFLLRNLRKKDADVRDTDVKRLEVVQEITELGSLIRAREATKKDYLEYLRLIHKEGLLEKKELYNLRALVISASE